MIAVFLHPIGWGAKRVILMCGADAEAFYPAECSIGEFLNLCHSITTQNDTEMKCRSDNNLF